jgi:ElaB/YqjD/DUF883 family membrane-anchored ribosome-binding protein
MQTSNATSSNTALSSLSNAADQADRRLAAAAHDAERVHRQVERALQRSVTGHLPRERRWPDRMDPLVNRVSSSARQWARQGADMASQAGHMAQASLNRYADATTGYISRQPVRSVLIAAAVGAAVSLLLAAGRKRY